MFFKFSVSGSHFWICLCFKLVPRRMAMHLALIRSCTNAPRVVGDPVQSKRAHGCRGINLQRCRNITFGFLVVKNIGFQSFIPGRPLHKTRCRLPLRMIQTIVTASETYCTTCIALLFVYFLDTPLLEPWNIRQKIPKTY